MRKLLDLKLPGLKLLGLKRLGLMLLVSGLPVWAQPADKAKQVIDGVIEALGGAKFQQMRNRVESGRAYSFYRENLTGLSIASIYTEYLPSPPTKGLSVRERQVFGKKQDYSVLFLEDEGWDITFRGARPLPEDTLSRYLSSTENNIFYILRTRYNEPGLQFDYIGSDVILNVPVDIVDVVDAQNRTVRVYVQQSTKLPLRQVYTRTDPKTKYRIEEMTEFSKYRAMNGVTWPLVVRRERNGEKIYEMFADKVEMNQDFPSTTFELPPGIKKLKK